MINAYCIVLFPHENINNNDQEIRFLVLLFIYLVGFFCDPIIQVFMESAVKIKAFQLLILKIYSI